MNCANHPEVAAAAYCQSCGKPLCTGCMRSVGGVIYCEPCLAARLSPPPMGGAAVPATGFHAHPVLAGLLGFIPGVGAMYNGQFVKALAHVLIFAVFVSLSDRNSFFGLLAAAWTFYQVFDAAQTAKARRDGLPLPNPFGLNDLGVRLGMTPAAPSAIHRGFRQPRRPVARPRRGIQAPLKAQRKTPPAVAPSSRRLPPTARPATAGTPVAGSGVYFVCLSGLIQAPVQSFGSAYQGVIQDPSIQVPSILGRSRPSPRDTGTRSGPSCSSSSACCCCCIPWASSRRNGSAGLGRSSSSA